MMYSSIFSDIHIDDRRMRKRADDIVEAIMIETVIAVDPIIAVDPLIEFHPIIEEDQGTIRWGKWNTTTYTIFTPGNTKMAEAMAIKSIADEFMGAAGTVAGAMLAFSAIPNYGSVAGAAQFGEKVGRGLGNWMYYSLL